MITIERASGSRRLGVWSLLGLVVVPLLVAGGFLWATWDSSSRLGRVQAAVVNSDEPVTIDGQLVPLGRQLAGGLVNGDPDRPEENFDWILTDTDDAADGLASGRYAAVVTIPVDFSANATSISKSEADQIRPAEIVVQVSEVSGIADSAVGQVITETARNELNTELTERYLDNVYLGFDTMGEQFTTLADGARQLADGARQLSGGVAQASDGTEQLADGLGRLDNGAVQLASGLRTMADQTAGLPSGAQQLATGGADLAEGAHKAADGVTRYIEDGVGSLRHGTNERPGGTAEFAAGAQQFADGVVSYQQTMQGYAQLSDEALGGFVPCPVSAEQCPIFYAGLRAGIGVGISGFDDQQTADGEVPGLVSGSAQLAAGAAGLDTGVGLLIKQGERVPAGLTKLAEGADRYAAGVAEFAEGMGPLQSGIAESAEGGAALASGVTATAAGADDLSDGLAKLTAGSVTLADGTQEFATGVAAGIDELPSYDAATRQQLSAVVSTPVTAERTSWLYADQATTTFLAVVALWIGALATYLVVAAVPSRVLTSTEPSWRLALAGLLPGAAIAGVQAVAFTAVLQALLDLDASQVARLLPLALLAGVAFVAVNHALVAWLHGVGRFISVAVLVASAAGSITSAVPAAFDAVRPLLPPIPALAGFRAIVTDGPGAGAAAGALLGWLIVGVAASLVAVARRRVASPLAIPGTS